MEPMVRDQLHADRRFFLVLGLLRSINEAFRELYSAGAWLTSAEASKVGSLGLRALRSYHQLAKASVELQQPRFPIHPKFHMMWHIFHGLVESSQRLAWVESPICDSCQQDEGFVGVISRYSRRVSPKLTIWRTLDLYTTSLLKRWRRD